MTTNSSGGSTTGAPLNADVILASGREALLCEADAIKHLATSLGNDFVEAVDLIVRSDGRVIVTGLGKSGLVGRKIAASLASTGSPAHFVHSTEALHGDVGSVLSGDVMIAISNSGETAEVLAFTQIAKQRGAGIVAITRSSESSLGGLADVTLEVAVAREADPHDLAPTTSTTAVLAMGDALAVALMVVKEFGREDFLENHPEGSLGLRKGE